MISFEPLRLLLVKKNIRKMDFLEKCNLTVTTAQRLWNDQNVSTESLDRICKGLNCTLADIVEFREESEANT